VFYHRGMSEAFCTLLDATIQYVEALKAAGTKCVPVNTETLAALAVPHPRWVARPVAATPAPQPVPSASRRTIPSPLDSANSTAISPETAMKKEAKVTALAALRQQVLCCQLCPALAKARTHVVFGVGNVHSSLMFVGEAPGADEDAQGEPFVGKAGQLLTKIIQAMGLSRDTVYIANILKCRPDTPGQTAGNRKPTPAEMKTCLPHLLAQIEIIQPRVMVALGATAVEGLLGLTTGITKLRGHFQTFQGIPVMPTYHPAYLLRNQAMAVKREVWEDMLQVMEKTGMPISEKQRNFFLSR
jgi:uracil-DNA glycosylase